MRKQILALSWLSVCLSASPSICMEQLRSYCADFYEIWYLSMFQKSVEKTQVSSISDKNNKYCTWRPMYICDNMLLNLSNNEKCFKQKLWRISKHILCSITPPPKKILHVWDNVERYCRARQATDGNIMRHVHFAYWIVKATETHSDCIILLAFAQQHWLCKCTSMLRLHVHCLSCSASFINHVWNESAVIYLVFL